MNTRQFAVYRQADFPGHGVTNHAIFKVMFKSREEMFRISLVTSTPRPLFTLEIYTHARTHPQGTTPIFRQPSLHSCFHTCHRSRDVSVDVFELATLKDGPTVVNTTAGVVS